MQLALIKCINFCSEVISFIFPVVSVINKSCLLNERTKVQQMKNITSSVSKQI